MADTKKLDSRLSLAVSGKLESDIKAAAKREARTPSAWARLALEKAVEQSRKGAPK